MFPLELVDLTLEESTVTAVCPTLRAVGARIKVLRCRGTQRSADLFSLSCTAVPLAIFFTTLRLGREPCLKLIKWCRGRWVKIRLREIASIFINAAGCEVFSFVQRVWGIRGRMLVQNRFSPQRYLTVWQRLMTDWPNCRLQSGYTLFVSFPGTGS